MPSKSYKKCNVMNCPELTADTYCDKHQQDNDKKQAHRDYKRNRTDKKEQAFYSSSAWIKMRNYWLSKEPLCKHCLEQGRVTPAILIDHMIPVKVDWSLRLDVNNMQSLCQRCHNIKSAEDRKLYEELR